MPDPTNLPGFPFPYRELAIDKDGGFVEPGEPGRAADVVDGDVTDVLVISHGWNNDVTEARALYTALATNMESVLRSNPPPSYGDRKLAVVGVVWPSKKFADSDVVAGGAAAVGSGADADDIRAELDELAAFLDRPEATAALERAKDLVDSLDSDPDAAALVELVRGVLAESDEERADPQDASREFFVAKPAELLTSLERPVFVGPAIGSPPAGGAAGGAAGLVDALRARLRAARNLLNYATYYEMKARAGAVGRGGVAELLGELHTRPERVRIHLAGHSFGARVVSMAALSTSPAVPISSISLLQAAFSHYSFATDWEGSKDGAFIEALASDRLVGPMVLTHTANDKAVGIAYAIASRVAGQVAASVGGPTDKYGGLGRNGALKTAGSTQATLLAATGSYALGGHRVHNLLADKFVSDHGDVSSREIALAVLSAIAAEA